MDLRTYESQRDSNLSFSKAQPHNHAIQVQNGCYNVVEDSLGPADILFENERSCRGESREAE